MTRPGNNSQQHANEQRAARRAVTAGPLCRIIVKRPRLLCAMVALVPLLATVIIALTHSFKITDPSGVDYLVRNDLRTVQDAARRAAREYTGNIRNQILPPPSVEPSREQHGLSTGNRSFSTTGPKGDIERGDEIDTYALHFLFRVRPQPGAAPIKDVREANRAPNVLTPEYLAQIKQAEDKLISNPKYQDFCWVDIAARSCNGQRPPCAFRRSITLHPLLYGLNDTDGRVCGVRDDANPVSRVQFDLFLRALIVSDPRGNRRIDPEYAWFLGRDAAASTLLEPSSLRTFVIRSYFPFGLPLRGYNTVDSDRSEQDDKFKSWALDVVTPIQESVTDPPQSRLHLIAVGDEYANNVFGIQALKDLSFAIAAIVLVLLFIWIHTRSLFLALAAMLQVILAFPLSYFFYRVVAQVRYFSALQIMCIFLVLGIAADDCFVYVLTVHIVTLLCFAVIIYVFSLVYSSVASYFPHRYVCGWLTFLDILTWIQLVRCMNFCVLQTIICVCLCIYMFLLLLAFRVSGKLFFLNASFLPLIRSVIRHDNVADLLTRGSKPPLSLVQLAIWRDD